MDNQIPLQVRRLRIYKNRFLKYDIVSGFVVFLVAIPLCLGIALASGAPLLSGLISGIIGGLITGMLSASQVSVSGPAAGMAAVVFTAIQQLGGFEPFLFALVLAGLLQFITGQMKFGFPADYIPSNVVQGLLCAIGILLIVKQLPNTFTLSTDLFEVERHLSETTESFSLHPFFDLSYHLNFGAIIISILSMALLVFMDNTSIERIKQIPAPVLVVILGIVLNEYFILSASPYAQNNPQLVNIPNHNGFFDLLSTLSYPDISTWSNPNIYLYALIIAIVASLESLLNVKASERLDPQKRYCSKDKELVAQGVGNIIAGLLGGIPVTSVIVRTSVNIQAGAKTKYSAVLHGAYILIAILLIPDILNKIPLASLACILIFTGYKLTKPIIYKTMYQQGIDRFIPFLATVISIVVFNLLQGILIGLAISFFYILKSNSQIRLDMIKEIYPNGVASRLILPQQITFLNKASLIAELDSIPRHAQFIIDARYSDYIDREIIELIREFKEEQAPLKKIALNLIGFKESYDIHDYIDFINVTTYHIQTKISPAHVLTLLKEGNQRFLKDMRIHRSNQLDVQYTAATQHPIAVVLGCIDSRVPVETIFDMTFGDLFCIRIAGNVVNNDILASIEYACHVVGAKLIVVLGHTRCGAIASACDQVKQGHITQLLDKIKPALNAEKETITARNNHNTKFVQNITSLNIANTLHTIYNDSDILKSMLDHGEVGMVGAIYDVTTGVAHFDHFIKEYRQICPDQDSHLLPKLEKILTEAEKTALSHKNTKARSRS